VIVSTESLIQSVSSLIAAALIPWLAGGTDLEYTVHSLVIRSKLPVEKMKGFKRPEAAHKFIAGDSPLL